MKKSRVYLIGVGLTFVACAGMSFSAGTEARTPGGGTIIFKQDVEAVELENGTIKYNTPGGIEYKVDPSDPSTPDEGFENPAVKVGVGWKKLF